MPARVAVRLAAVIRPGDRLTLGLSGGLDSVVLLDCLARAAPALKFRLSALHVNHQLSRNAGNWLAFCRELCRARGVPLASVRVRVRGREGPEAAARAARYRAFSGRDCDHIVLAHHRDDQVETFLLQLLRGAGAKGLAAMPLARRTEGAGAMPRRSSPSSPGILRPLLDTTRSEIVEYARARGLKWIEDESNDDIRLRRNFLRHEVLPLVEGRYPAYRETIARAVEHLADAAAVLDEVAAADAARWIADGTVAVAGLRRLPPARARNLLRYFVASHGVAPPPATRLAEALRQVLDARPDARVAVEIPGGMLRRFSGRVHFVDQSQGVRFRVRRWRGEGRLVLPELGGVLTMGLGTGRGISLARLRRKAVTVRVRQGGERLQPDCRRPRRSLKNLLQEAQVPPWRRERLPLIYCEEELVWAPGIGIACAFQAPRGAPALRPEWAMSGGGSGQSPVGSLGRARKP